MRSAYKASSRRRDLGIFRGAYLVKRGCRGSRGLGSGRGGCGVGLVVEVRNHCKILYGEFAFPPYGHNRQHTVSTHPWRRVDVGRHCWRRGRVEE